jgi:hypothetical protein
VSRIAAPAGDIDVQREVGAVYDLVGAERWLIDVRRVDASDSRR